jgi:translocation protein SEC62
MSTNEQQQKASQEIRNVVNFLRSSKAGLKNRVGVLNGKRVDYFKGMMRPLSPSIPPAYALL